MNSKNKLTSELCYIRQSECIEILQRENAKFVLVFLWFNSTGYSRA